MIVFGQTKEGLVRQPLSKIPHMLVAGMTGSGKSVFTHGVITQLIANYGPETVALVMIDPKRVELAQYRGIPHLVDNPFYTLSGARSALEWTVGEMSQRFTKLETQGLRDFDAWNDKPDNPHWSRLVVVVDELANLILADKKLESPIVSLASMGRAAGVHLILATQRPSADVLTGLIRANVPTRVCMAVVTKMDSRIVLDEAGAEEIRQPGRALVRLARERSLLSVQTELVTNSHIERAVELAKTLAMPT